MVPVTALAVSGFGVRYDVSLPPGFDAPLTERLAGCFRVRPVTRSDPSAVPVVVRPLRDGFTLRLGRRRTRRATQASAIDGAASFIEMETAATSPTHVFLHSGVVAWRGQAIVFPGRTMTGKSTLVRRAVERGARYYSDEFAPIDSSGRVESFPRPVNVRRPGRRRGAPVPLPGAGRRGKSLPVSHVVFARYEPQAVWRPAELSPGEAVLELVKSAVTTHAAPARTLDALALLATNAVVLDGARGEADDVLDELLR